MYKSGRVDDQPKIVVPPALRYNILRLFHDTKTGGHLGRNKMYSKMTKRFWYKGCSIDCRNFVKSCFLCRSTKSSPPNKQGYMELFPPTEVGEYVALDLFGPLPRSLSGNTYVVVLCDRLSKWVEFIPAPDMLTETIADIILGEWIFRYGVMKILITDRAAQFTSDLIKILCEKN